jgi:hypothetical protein
MSQELLRSLVWLDYRLGVLFAVILPLVLSGWALFRRADAMQRLLLIYWRVASLLAITGYLMIGGYLFSFLAGLMAHILIPIGLWFWIDLNEEIDDQRRTPLKLAFTAWRWAMSVYSGLSAIAMLPFLNCAFSKEVFSSPRCQVWLEPPLVFKDHVHPTTTTGFLGVLGIMALVIYLLYLAYFVFIRLGRQGRTAISQ